MKVEMSKKYKTKCGLVVRRVLCIDRLATDYPVVVEMGDGEIETYTAEGAYDEAYPSGSMSLIEISECHDFQLDDKVVVRINSYADWHKQYLAGVNEEGNPTAFPDGFTSRNTIDTPDVWEECRKPTEEELK